MSSHANLTAMADALAAASAAESEAGGPGKSSSPASTGSSFVHLSSDGGGVDGGRVDTLAGMGAAEVPMIETGNERLGATLGLPSGSELGFGASGDEPLLGEGEEEIVFSNAGSGNAFVAAGSGILGGGGVKDDSFVMDENGLFAGVRDSASETGGTRASRAGDATSQAGLGELANRMATRYAWKLGWSQVLAWDQWFTSVRRSDGWVSARTAAAERQHVLAAKRLEGR